MRFAFCILALLTIGCERTGLTGPSGPHLRFVDVATSVGAYPTIFAARLSNDGDAVAQIDAVRLRVLHKTLLFDAADLAPPAFDHTTVIYEGNPDYGGTPLGPGKTIEIKAATIRDVIGNVVWHVNEDAPPMLAIVTGQFQVLRNGDVLAELDPLIMVLESKPGAITAVRAVRTADPRKAAAVVKGLREIEGRRSIELEELIETIEAAGKQGI
jgi:hypothetical protein